MQRKNKSTSRKYNPNTKNQTSIKKEDTYQNKNLIWKVTKIDEDGKWGWNNITCPKFLKKLWNKMRNFETMTWGQILGNKHHIIPINQIVRPAQDRLKTLKYDDQEELMSFRISSKERIWAIRSNENSYLLWWDPNHEIYPSSKKHT